MLEGAKTPGEAQAASLALQRLMAKSGLSADQVEALSADDATIPIVEGDVYIGTNDIAWKKMLAAVIADNFRCEAIFCSAQKNVRMKTIVFIGRDEDVRIASECYKLTIKTAQRCFKRYSKWRTDRYFPINTKSAKVRNSYYIGFVEGLDDAFRFQVEESPELAIALQLPRDVKAYIDAKDLNYALTEKSASVAKLSAATVTKTATGTALVAPSPNLPGFHTFPQSEPRRALVVLAILVSNHGNVQKPPPPRIPLRGESGSKVPNCICA